ncbi:MAG TPA: hypothetical protein VMK65_05550 [Longimicrobiales bacterium]|nr:hypothetical protein [Longimicrobiales bacterium]
MRSPRLAVVLWTALVALLVFSGVRPAPASAQEAARRQARWTIGLEAGAQLPASIYNERVNARLEADSFFVSTSYEERMDWVPLVRATVRFRPEAGFGLYTTYQWSRASTTARYSGGREPVEVIPRDVSFWTFEAGVSVRLGEWGRRGGGIGYTMAPALVQHSLDLSSGHRDSFAQVRDHETGDNFDWNDRSWRSWAFALGVSARVPVTDRLAIRLGAHDHVIAVGTSELEAQDRADVVRMTGRAPQFLYSSYTAHYTALRGGFEYVLGWDPPPPEMPGIALPSRRAGPARTSAAAVESRTLVAQGDTAGALAVLRERVEQVPDDAGTWRELALVLAVVADSRPALRDEAWNVLQRALNLNPGESSLLTAYGRMQALMRRAGEQAARNEPLALSAVSASADAAGGLSVGFALRNLTGADGGGRYRLEVDVVDTDGRIVPLRVAGGEDDPLVDRLVLERDSPAEGAASERLELRLQRARPGPHNVRVRVTDLGSGQSVEGAGAFEIR